ncbi:fibrobacter succinogenes major paralogous domain-containing protein, partial [Bacteroidales bacterium OttesenSCG-928-K03]|nr:fibrobacter succinogenes major paralogous domain-containing protein [Bacteroidales bacterium OttesenSCG-928-K03]
DIYGPCADTNPPFPPINIDDNGLAYIWEVLIKREVASDTLPDIIQGICPNGWHIPSDEEWMELERYLGLTEEELYVFGYRGTNEATKIKEAGSLTWKSYNNNYETTNVTGMNIIGCRLSGEIQRQVFWSSTIHLQDNIEYPIFRRVASIDHQIYRDFDIYLSRRLCVRCIKNEF